MERKIGQLNETRQRKRGRKKYRKKCGKKNGWTVSSDMKKKKENQIKHLKSWRRK